MTGAYQVFTTTQEVGSTFSFNGVILNEACAGGRRGVKDLPDNARAMPTAQPPAGSPHPSSFVRYLILCVSPLLEERAAKCVVLDGG